MSIQLYPNEAGYGWYLLIGDTAHARSTRQNMKRKEALDDAQEFLSLIPRDQMYVGIGEPDD